MNRYVIEMSRPVRTRVSDIDIYRYRYIYLIVAQDEGSHATSMCIVDDPEKITRV